MTAFKNHHVAADHLEILVLVLKLTWHSGMYSSSIQAQQTHLSSSAEQTQIQNWSLKQMPEFRNPRVVRL
uniref:Uncharacterized protein n=1 Tax=Cannabis sativa TaxID=3483 RepID=A0A803R5I6_CANSA